MHERKLLSGSEIRKTLLLSAGAEWLLNKSILDLSLILRVADREATGGFQRSSGFRRCFPVRVFPKPDSCTESTVGTLIFAPRQVEQMFLHFS